MTHCPPDDWTNTFGYCYIFLLRHLPGDAVLLFNGEIVRLGRINGQLIFNQDFCLWSESELAEVELPFDCQPLPSPLLSAPAFLPR